MDVIAYDRIDPASPVRLVYEWGPGDEQGWHFDDNEFVISLLLQKPAQGGEFEYVPMIRSDPGTLALFRGTRSLHRVSPVGQGPTRLIALLSYDARPGMVFPPAVQRNNTGRTTSD